MSRGRGRCYFKLPGLMGAGGHLVGAGEADVSTVHRKIRQDIQRQIRRAQEGKKTALPISKLVKIAAGLETRDTSVPAEVKAGDTASVVEKKNKGKIREPGVAPRDHKAERAERKRRWKELQNHG